jgi:hypothetical protein
VLGGHSTPNTAVLYILVTFSNEQFRFSDKNLTSTVPRVGRPNPTQGCIRLLVPCWLCDTYTGTRRYLVVIFRVRADEWQPCSVIAVDAPPSNREELTQGQRPPYASAAGRSPHGRATRGRNTRARRAVAYARWYCGSGCHTVARLLDAPSQLAPASAQPAAVTTRRVRVAHFYIVHANPECGYV